MREEQLVFVVVVPDEQDPAPVLEHLRGREFPGLPGSWVVAASAGAAGATGAARSPAAPGRDAAPDRPGEGVDPADLDPGDLDPGDLDPGDLDPGDLDPGDADRW